MKTTRLVIIQELDAILEDENDVDKGFDVVSIRDQLVFGPLCDDEDLRVLDALLYEKNGRIQVLRNKRY